MVSTNMIFDDQEIAHLEAWRRKLHQFPEISGEEVETAREVTSFLADTKPDATITNLGGHGVALVYEGAEPGPTVLLRCELDALAIQEISDIPHRSRTDGKAHMCGHDGHMTMMAAVARILARRRPSRGRAVLLFQPAEETAHGAEAVLADPKFGAIAPDYAFAIHNMPGLPLAHVAVAGGQITCASMGLLIELIGKTSHASVPEAGISPAMAIARIIPALKRLEAGEAIEPGFRRVTVTNVQMGNPVFGITPGVAELRMTLRTPESGAIEGLCADVLELVGEIAASERLMLAHSTHNFFRACINDPEAAAIFEAAAGQMGLSRVEGYAPIRGAEDFGLFGSCSKSAMLFIGSGMDRPMVHNPDYDFPDELIPVGAGLFLGVLDNVLGPSAISETVTT
ncbi:amidohydrolase [Mesorhizobium mediterraneum]|uniref:amidohydrolase n=1 Tax=Mesorhizobium mediterraneum TaxID=43617 RepID=UPI001FEE330A|nr:amidohydrolase [Mesorhizobium mediterraneum]